MLLAMLVDMSKPESHMVQRGVAFVILSGPCLSNVITPEVGQIFK